jgi:DNA topoisomerase-1
VRDETKYDRMFAFAAALGKIRSRTKLDLAQPGLPREKVLAAVVQLLEKTLIRVGNEEYVRANGSFGLTTLHNRHVNVRGARVTFRFRGKSGREHDVGLEDPRLAAVVRRCRELPGQELFAYVDEAGEIHSVGSADVNDYLREITGQDFTAKGLPHMGRHGARAAGAAAVPDIRFGCGSQAQRRGGDRVGRANARQHQGRVPQVVHPPDADRCLSRRRQPRARDRPAQGCRSAPGGNRGARDPEGAAGERRAGKRNSASPAAAGCRAVPRLRPTAATAGSA